MTEVTPFLALRMCFEKLGPIRFISHLDLSRSLHRAFVRAELPLKFSEGFSPHPKFSLALPLSVGTESITELADFSLAPGFDLPLEEIRERLQKEMPAGVRILWVKPQGEKFSAIAYATYRVTLPLADPALIPAAEDAMKGSITVMKRNKKGKMVEKEISQGIQSLQATAENGVTLNLCLGASGEEYLKPELVLAALEERVPALQQEGARILRCGVLRGDLTQFE